jgi:murein L,D-transpeptidase YafK
MPPARLIFFLFLAGTDVALAAEQAAPCSGRGTLVLVLTGEHKLYACHKDAAALSYDVRFGHKGVGKKSTGDGKTPLGSYPLASPRPSQRYGTFIPIGYPTPEQRRQGYTGGAVGIHGPIRHLKWIGGPLNWFDTTDGCIGLARDEEMQALAKWVRTRKTRKIVLE